MAHDFELERTAMHALGALSDKEAEEAEIHLISCEPCMDEYVALREAADLIGLAAEVVSDEHDLRLKRVEKRLAFAIQRHTRRPLASVSSSDSWYRTAAAAALLCAIGVSAWAGVTAKSLNSTQIALQRSEEARRLDAAAASQANERLAVLLAPDAKSYTVATGTVVTHDHYVYLAMSKLPALPPNRVFQAWTVAPGASGVAPNVTFVRNAHGIAFVRLTTDRNVPPAAIAVSVEPAGGSQQPTTKPLFVQTLS